MYTCIPIAYCFSYCGFKGDGDITASHDVSAPAPRLGHLPRNTPSPPANNIPTKINGREQAQCCVCSVSVYKHAQLEPINYDCRGWGLAAWPL